MLYQLYPHEAAFEPGFSALYQPFSLNPLTNSALIKNSPELENEANRYALAEYAAMLNLWRNDDGETWIGFTSARQKSSGKSDYVVQVQDLPHLQTYDILTWYWHWAGNLSWQGELSYPGVNEALKEALSSRGYALPKAWEYATHGVFANYWILKKQDFVDYMSWSYPVLEWCLRNPRQIPFLKKSLQHYTGVGMVMERLFLVWYLTYQKTVFDLVSQRVVYEG